MFSTFGGSNRVVLVRGFTAPTNYCPGKINSLGCTPTGEWLGEATLTGPDDFVVCSNQVLANGLRRQAVRRSPALGRSGLAGVEFTTVNRLAEKIVAPMLEAQDGHVASRIELLAVVRERLAQEPGAFGAVADHRTTEDRLVTFFHDISGLGSDVRDRMEAAADGLSKDAFRVARQVSSSMGTAFAEDRIIELALQELGLTPEFEAGPLILFNPDPTRPYEGRLFQAIARRQDATLLMSLTGHRRIDEAYRQRLAAWGIQVEFDEEQDDVAADGPRLAALIEVAAPDEEVRAAIREVSAHAASGLPLDDMAVLYTYADPYASLLTEQLAAAGLPFRSHGYRPLAMSLAGRTLRRLISLAVHGLDRSSVIGLLNSAPIDQGDGTEVPAQRWDRISRQAGVIDGDHWESRLAELARSIEVGVPKDAASASTVVSLSDFVTELRERVRPPARASWQAWSDWAQALLDRYLRPIGVEGAHERTWPDIELAALHSVRALLDRISGLDRHGGSPRLDTFEATIVSELNGVVMPSPGAGHGLLVAPIDVAGGLPVARAVVVGAAEGQFPRVPREDSLLPDQLRASADGLMIEKNLITEIDIRSAAIVAESTRVATSFYQSRGDLRSNRSRVWPEALRSIVGADLAVVASHHQGLIDHGRPVAVEDFGLRALVAHVDGGDPVNTHALAARDQVLADGLRRQLNRARAELTEHTGRVRRNMIDLMERLLSPTALETYALCPRKYLFQRVLRLEDDERPERIAEITARERGQLIHRVLERFVSEALAAETVPAPGERWSPDLRGRLLDILEEEIKLDQSRGVTGGEVRTRLLRQWLVSEMHHFLDTDDKLRSERQSVPFAAEYKFGFDDNPALEGSVAGRQLRLRGSVDRVDLTSDGGLMVIDYKGGSGRQFQTLDDNPLDDGRRLQLPLYARVVAERLDRRGPRVGVYWLTREDEILDVILDEDLEIDLEETVGAALDGISEGLFPGVPGSAVSWPRLTFENCRYCDFERICPTDRQSEWERVKSDPDLKPINVVLRASERSS